MPHSAVHNRRKYTTVADAAEYLGVTPPTIYKMISDGHLPGYRHGRRLLRVDLNDLDALMQPSSETI